jgi:hypothetical protein
VTSPRLFRLLLWVHWRTLLARRRGIRRESPLLPAVLGAFVLCYLAVGYWLFHSGLNYLLHHLMQGRFHLPMKREQSLHPLMLVQFHHLMRRQHLKPLRLLMLRLLLNQLMCQQTLMLKNWVKKKRTKKKLK